MPAQPIIFEPLYCQQEDLFPFTLTRGAEDLRAGILTIREKWERWGFSVAMSSGSGPLLLRIAPNLLPDAALVGALKALQPGQRLADRDGRILASAETAAPGLLHGSLTTTGAPPTLSSPVINYDHQVLQIRYPWDLVAHNDRNIQDDFELLTNGRNSAGLPASNTVTGDHPVFLEVGASVEYCHFNTSKGPVYIGPGAELMEGSFIRGPFAIGEGALLKMGSRVYGATSIGPWSIAAGEIKNSILTAYSNKAHDGYLGDSVIGAWCNFGAGTTNSNLKNNAGMLRMWTPGGLVAAGNKCGVMMGDYTRTAINTSINTGTVIGISANVFGAGLTPRYIRSFSWGSAGSDRYELEKALNDIDAWKRLKNQTLTEQERIMIERVYQQQQQ